MTPPHAPHTRAVLLDALGTLVELEPPWIPLAAALRTQPDERMVAAFRAEMSYYREHSHEGRNVASLAELRRRCAAILSRGLDREVDAEEMMAAIRFRAFDDAAPALAALRVRSVKLVCVSNWDFSLPEVLDRVGIGGMLDAVVTSAATGSRKPEPGIFEAALRAACSDAGEALHVGDTPGEDIAGAGAAGIRSLLLDRGGHGDIASLTEIERHL